MLSLSEKYRPRTLDEVIGQDKAVTQARRLLESGCGGRAVYIAGPTGSGKTTVARILAGTLADEWLTMEYDSADDFKADEVERLRDSMGLLGTGKGGRAWIINEAHGLRAPVIRQLLGIIERLPNHCLLVFTTTDEGSAMLFDGIDARPLVSRCWRIDFSSYGVQDAFARRCMEIARVEHLDGQPIGAYKALAKRCMGSMRAMLAEIEAGAMKGGAA